MSKNQLFYGYYAYSLCFFIHIFPCVDYIRNEYGKTQKKLKGIDNFRQGSKCASDMYYKKLLIREVFT